MQLIRFHSDHLTDCVRRKASGPYHDSVRCIGKRVERWIWRQRVYAWLASISPVHCNPTRTRIGDPKRVLENANVRRRSIIARAIAPLSQFLQPPGANFRNVTRRCECNGNSVPLHIGFRPGARCNRVVCVFANQLVRGRLLHDQRKQKRQATSSHASPGGGSDTPGPYRLRCPSGKLRWYQRAYSRITSGLAWSCRLHRQDFCTSSVSATIAVK